MDHHPRGMMHLEIFGNSLAQNLDLLGDVLWMVTYALLIVIAFRERVPGIPSIAICLNFTWELVYTFAHAPPSLIHLVVQLIWLALDCVIVFQVLRFGNMPQMSKRHYNVGFLIGVVLAFLGHLVYIRHYSSIDPNGATLAYLINLVMSVTFISMLFHRPGSKGISYTVAWTKMLATAVITVSVFLRYPLDLVGMILYVGFCTAIFDIYYIYRIHTYRPQLTNASSTAKAENASPAAS